MIRKLLHLLLAAALFTACGDDDPAPERIRCSLDEAVLRSTAGSAASFTVTASGPWTLSSTGAGFDVAPVSGGRGATEVTLTATKENTERQRVTLGTLTLQLTELDVMCSVRVTQSPAVAPRTVVMYLPWSGPAPYDLTSYFEQNIADMERIVAEGALGDERLLVYFMPDAQSAELFELYHDNGKCVRKPQKSYQTPPAFTTAAGIASILGDAEQAAPARHYALTVGCHGMAWLPVYPQGAQAATAGPAEKEYWEAEGPWRTRWFGGTSSRYQTDITTLAAGISDAGMHMDYILFDDCYMSSVEVAYELREVTDCLIGSTSEIMAYGFPYARMGRYLFGEVDYAAVCDAFYDFYISYEAPYGTIGVTDCSEVEALAALMRRINARHTFDPAKLNDLQRLDGYTPVRFFDLGDYVRHLCTDQALLSEFEEQLARTVPFHRHTPSFYSMTNGVNPIRTYSGITTSDPSVSSAVSTKDQTAWWKATHE